MAACLRQGSQVAHPSHTQPTGRRVRLASAHALGRRPGDGRMDGPGAARVPSLAGGAPAVAPRVDGRSFGGFLAHRIVCAVRGGCRRRRRRARARVRAADAELVRDHAPGLVYEPGERRCRSTTARCRSPRLLRRARRPRPRRTPHATRGSARRCSPACCAAAADLHPVLALLPGLEHRLGGLGRAVGAQRAAAAGRARSCAGPPLPRLPPRRLGGLPGPDRAGRARAGRAPPRTATTRAASSGLPRTAGCGASGLDARLAREPRRPPAARAAGPADLRERDHPPARACA